MKFPPTSIRIDNDPFGVIGARRYDKDAHHITRRYKSAHARQNATVIAALKRAAVPHPIVVDFGCGTGNDGVSILSGARKAFYLGVDRSEEMLRVATAKFNAHRLNERSGFINHDIRTITKEDLSVALRARDTRKSADCVVSALVLHHFKVREKRALYQLTHEILTDGGLLVLTDLYTSAIECCAHQALQREIDDLRRTLTRLGEDHSANGSSPTTLSEQHYIDENQPSTLLAEVNLLSSVGFDRLDILYRSAQLSVIVAEK